MEIPQITTFQDLFFNAITTSNPDVIIEVIHNHTLRPWEWQDLDGYNAIHKCAVSNMFSLTQLILKELKLRLASEDSEDILPNFVNHSSKNGSRPIHFASFRGNIQLIELLISFGADIMAANAKGMNALHMAAQGDQPSSLIYLCEELGFSLLNKDKDGNTAFHWACYLGNENFFDFSFLYEREISSLINEPNSDGLTPMHLAVFSDKKKFIRKLYYKGASLGLGDKKGRTPYQIAKEKDKPIIQAMLLELGSSSYVKDPLMFSPSSGCSVWTNFIFFIVSHFIIESLLFFVVLPFIACEILSYLYLLSFGLLFILFFSFSCSDPGYLSVISDAHSSLAKLHDLVKNSETIDILCPYCLVNRSQRIKHCYLCKRCVKDYDHHCIWGNICVGKKNIWIFFLFVTFAIVNFCLNIYVSGAGLFYITGEETNTIDYHEQMNLKHIIEKSTFPPKLKLLTMLHKHFRVALCAFSLVLFLIFIVPVLNLWAFHVRNCLGLFTKQNKKGANGIDANNQMIIIDL